MTYDPSKPIRWGIVSAGKISGDFCIALRTLPSHEHKIVSVAARSIDNAKTFAERHGIQKYYDSYEKIASDPDVDVVYIGTIHPSHVALSILMLEAGKNVLCEKPMALSSAGVKKVIEVAQRKKLLFVEGFWSRFFPAYKQLQSELKEGSIGTVKGLIASFGVDFNWETLERVSKKEQGGGVVLDIGCYLIQLACLVFGSERPEKIYVNGSLHHTGVDKTADIMLCYKDGRTAQLTASGECQLPNNAIVHGSKGFIEVMTPFWSPTQLKTSTKSHTFDLPTPVEPTHFTNSVGFIHEIQGVRHALLNGLLQAPEITHADSLLIAEIQDEILRQLGVTYDMS